MWADVPWIADNRVCRMHRVPSARNPPTQCRGCYERPEPARLHALPTVLGLVSRARCELHPPVALSGVSSARDNRHHRGAHHRLWWPHISISVPQGSDLRREGSDQAYPWRTHHGVRLLPLSSLIRPQITHNLHQLIQGATICVAKPASPPQRGPRTVPSLSRALLGRKAPPDIDATPDGVQSDVAVCFCTRRGRVPSPPCACRVRLQFRHI